MTSNGFKRSQPDGSGDLASGADHVVFLGVYNPTRFKKKIEKWLPKLDLTGTLLVVSDNHSSDESLGWLASLVGDMGVPHCLVSHPANYGGYGNLASSFDALSNTRWVTTLHQDDYYLTSHVQNHRLVIANHSGPLGMVYSEAVSEDEVGNSIAYPRAHWLLEGGSDPVTIFLAHLRNHVFPFSGATFSMEVLRKFQIPWHSTAFPDTEIVMKMIVEYQVSKAQQQTVKYLENPRSESHSLSPEHRDYGVFQALFRVFAHPNYKRICDLVPDDQLEQFLTSLDVGIRERFKDRKLSALMKQAAFEITAQHRGRTNATMAQSLMAGYQEVDDQTAMSVLISLGAKQGVSPESKLQVSPIESTVAASIETKSRIISLLGYLPLSARKFLFRLLMATPIGKRLLPAWDFDWKRP